MHSIIEFSFKGDLYFFENTLTNTQLQLINDFVQEHYKDKIISSKNSIQSFVDDVWNELHIQLIPVFIEVVIAI